MNQRTVGKATCGLGNYLLNRSAKSVVSLLALGTVNRSLIALYLVFTGGMSIIRMTEGIKQTIVEKVYSPI